MENENLDPRYIEAYISGTQPPNPNTIMYYTNAFSKYELNGGGFALHWSWASFFLGWIHLCYRRAYLEALIIALCSAALSGFSLGMLIILVWVITGCLNPYLIYKRYIKNLQMLKIQNISHDAIVMRLRMAGGVNKAVPIIAGIFIGLFILLMILVFVLAMIGIATGAVNGFDEGYHYHYY